MLISYFVEKFTVSNFFIGGSFNIRSSWRLQVSNKGEVGMHSG
jgi:hypothetical protein